MMDVLGAKMKRGATLEVAAAEAAQHFGDPVTKVALNEAVTRIRKSISEIERLRHPTTLRKRERIAWYPGPQDTDTYWPALRAYLRDEKKRSESVIRSIDESSSKVVASLDFPGGARFKTRGLVVGYVQSGKTANFTAVISKAADAGFRVFLVLSGLTNSLRKQTQERLNEELVKLQPSHWLTWTDLERDFGDYTLSIDALLNNEQRHLAVIKKNGPRLRRLRRMISNANPQTLAQCPIMIIDDECDQASVNASGKQDRPSAINELLRSLLDKLPRVAYVGYTATPYANVLIDPTYLKDLYPRDFIVALPRPSAYFGAERLFGRDLLDADPVPPEEGGLNMIRRVPDSDATSLRPPSREARGEFVLGVTPTLATAIRYFVLATAAKCVRGLAGEHSSMLIHTTAYAQPHLNARPVLERFVAGVHAAVLQNDQAELQLLRDLWANETALLPASLLGQTQIFFDELMPHLRDDANWPTVVVENSASDERLDFSVPARRYIVVGGNVLARGLTIDGLVVSFFLRTAGQYDTLMQMGRWFGYRSGYEDLPRIWMTDEMAGYFKDMATVEAEIRYDIEVYERDGLTPEEFAIRIRRIPDLAITARNKMLDAVECEVTFAGEHPQTRRFLHKDREWLARNWSAASTLMDRIQTPPIPARGASTAFGGVRFVEIIRFLREYQMHPSHQHFSPERLVDYIKRQNEAKPDSLTDWTVAVIGVKGGELSEFPLGRVGRVPMVSRAKLRYGSDADIKALMSKGDVLVDLPEVSAAGGAGWKELKDLRNQVTSAKRPLLLLYPIYRQSPAESPDGDRLDMDAEHDILGIGIVFPRPESPVVMGYVRARIDTLQDEDPEYPEEHLRDDDAPG